jgi:hypothetical protein
VRRQFLLAFDVMVVERERGSEVQAAFNPNARDPLCSEEALTLEQ